ncbi:MAG: RNA polymerase sigma factor [Myxococcota bacterium]
MPTPNPARGKMDQMDDSGIAALIAAGRLRDAIGAAAVEHGAAVERVCVALVGRPDRAAELAQDTFVAAVDALRHWRGDGSLRAFLCGIARNLCAKDRTRSARQAARLHLVRDPVADVDAHAAVEAGQRARAARDALSRLEPGDREILVLRYQGELGYAEIAALLSIDEPTARKRASRALVRLRSALPVEAP